MIRINILNERGQRESVSILPTDSIQCLQNSLSIDPNTKIYFVYRDFCILPFLSFEFYNIKDGDEIKIFKSNMVLPKKKKNTKHCTFYPSLKQILCNVEYFQLVPNQENGIMLYNGIVDHNFSETIARIRDAPFAKTECCSLFHQKIKKLQNEDYFDYFESCSEKSIIPPKPLKPSTETLPKFW